MDFRRTPYWARLAMPAHQRFMEKVNIDASGCWIWMACRDTRDYGMFSGKAFGLPRAAHRAAYELFVGPIGGKWVLHKCDNPPCVNPDHLYLGTPKQNTKDMLRRGRHFSPGRNKTHCLRGHALTKDNVYVPPKRPSQRNCIACQRIRSEKLKQKSEANKNVDARISS